MRKPKKTEGKLFRKLTAILLLISFTLLNTISNPYTAFAEPLPGSSFPHHGTNQEDTISRIGSLSLPEGLGTIHEKYLPEGKSSRLVIYLQSAHSNLDSETHTEGIIRHLEREYGLDLVLLEGGEGKLDSLFFKSFPDKEQKEKILKEYLEQGDLSGGEIQSILDESSDTPYYGIETQDLYDQNKDSFLKAVSEEEKITQVIDALGNELDQKAFLLDNANLLSFRTSFLSFHEDKEELLQYLKVLKTLYPKEDFSSIFPELHTLLTVEANQSKMTSEDHDALMTQVLNAFKERVLPKLSKDDSMHINSTIQDYQTQRLDQGMLLNQIAEYSNKAGLGFKIPEGLKEKAAESRKLSQIKGTKLFDEIERLESALSESLSKTKEENDVMLQDKEFLILKDLSKLELLPKDWEQLKQSPHDFESLIPQFKNLFKSHFEFYELASKRDEALFQNSLKLMQKAKAKITLLLTGGFHTEGITERFKTSNIPYILISPQITQLTDKSVYLKAMRDQRSFMKDRTTSSLWDALAKDYASKLAASLREDELTPSLKRWRDRIIQNSIAEGRITQATQYTKYVDALVQALRKEYDKTGIENKERGMSEGELKKAISRELGSFLNTYFNNLEQMVNQKLSVFQEGLKEMWKRKDFSQKAVEGLFQSMNTLPRQNLAVSLALIRLERQSVIARSEERVAQSAAKIPQANSAEIAKIIVHGIQRGQFSIDDLTGAQAQLTVVGLNPITTLLAKQGINAPDASEILDLVQREIHKTTGTIPAARSESRVIDMDELAFDMVDNKLKPLDSEKFGLTFKAIQAYSDQIDDFSDLIDKGTTSPVKPTVWANNRIESTYVATVLPLIINDIDSWTNVLSRKKFDGSIPSNDLKKLFMVGRYLRNVRQTADLGNNQSAREKEYFLRKLEEISKRAKKILKKGEEKYPLYFGPKKAGPWDQIAEGLQTPDNQKTTPRKVNQAVRSEARTVKPIARGWLNRRNFLIGIGISGATTIGLLYSFLPETDEQRAARYEEELRRFYKDNLPRDFPPFVREIGVEHKSFQWQGRNIELIMGAHGAPQGAQEIINVSHRVIANPTGWLVLLEGAFDPWARGSNFIDSRVLSKMVTDHNLSVIDPIPFSERDREVMEDVQKKLNLSREEVLASSIYSMLVFLFIEVQNAGLTPQGIVESLAAKMALPDDVIQIIVQKASQIKTEDAQETFAAQVNSVMDAMLETRNQFAKARLIAEIKNHPKQKNILALIGSDHAPIFDLPFIQDPPAAPFTARDLRFILENLSEAGLIRSEARESATKDEINQFLHGLVKRQMDNLRQRNSRLIVQFEDVSEDSPEAFEVIISNVQHDKFSEVDLARRIMARFAVEITQKFPQYRYVRSKIGEGTEFYGEKVRFVKMTEAEMRDAERREKASWREFVPRFSLKVLFVAFTVGAIFIGLFIQSFKDDPNLLPGERANRALQREKLFGTKETELMRTLNRLHSARFVIDHLIERKVIEREDVVDAESLYMGNTFHIKVKHNGVRREFIADFHGNTRTVQFIDLKGETKNIWDRNSVIEGFDTYGDHQIGVEYKDGRFLILHLVSGRPIAVAQEMNGSYVQVVNEIYKAKYKEGKAEVKKYFLAEGDVQIKDIFISFLTDADGDPTGEFIVSVAFKLGEKILFKDILHERLFAPGSDDPRPMISKNGYLFETGSEDFVNRRNFIEIFKPDTSEGRAFRIRLRSPFGDPENSVLKPVVSKILKGMIESFEKDPIPEPFQTRNVELLKKAVEILEKDGANESSLRSEARERPIAKPLSDEEARKLAKNIVSSLVPRWFGKKSEYYEGIINPLTGKINSIQFEIEGRTITVDSAVAGNRSILRIGPMIFVALQGRSPRSLKSQISRFKKQLGKLYDENPGNIIFPPPAYYADSPYPVPNVSFLTVATVLANASSLKDAVVAVPGAGDGLLAQIALRFGAERVMLIEKNEEALNRARTLLSAQGGRENEDFFLIQADLTDPSFEETVKNYRLADEVTAVLMNIGVRPAVYGEANQKAIEIVSQWPNVKVLINGGHIDYNDARGLMREFNPQQYPSPDSVLDVLNGIIQQMRGELEKQGFDTKMITEKEQMRQVLVARRSEARTSKIEAAVQGLESEIRQMNRGDEEIEGIEFRTEAHSSLMVYLKSGKYFGVLNPPFLLEFPYTDRQTVLAQLRTKFDLRSETRQWEEVSKDPKFSVTSTVFSEYALPIIAQGVSEILKQAIDVSGWNKQREIEVQVGGTLFMTGTGKNNKDGSVFIALDSVLLMRSKKTREEEIQYMEGKLDHDLDEGKVVYILSHELAHHIIEAEILEGTRKPMSAKETEFAADLEAAKYMWRMGFNNITQIKQIITEALKVYELTGIQEDETHPSLKDRVRRIDEAVNLISSEKIFYQRQTFQEYSESYQKNKTDNRSEARPVDVAAGIAPVFFGGVIAPAVLQQSVLTITTVPNLQMINKIIQNIREQLTREISQYRDFFRVNREAILNALKNLAAEGNINSENVELVLSNLGLKQIQIANLDPEGRNVLIQGIVNALNQIQSEIAREEPLPQTAEPVAWNDQDAATASAIVALSEKIYQKTVVDIEMPDEFIDYDDTVQISQFQSLAEAIKNSLVVVGALSVRIVLPDARAVKNWTKALGMFRTKGEDQNFNLTSRIIVINQKSAVNMRSLGQTPALIISAKTQTFEIKNSDVLDARNFANGDTVDYRDPPEGALAKFFGAGIASLTQKTVEGINRNENRLQVTNPKALNMIFRLVLSIMAQKAKELALARAA